MKPTRDPCLWALLCVVFATSLLSMPALRYDGDVNAWEMEAESLVHRGRLAVRSSVAESLPPSAPYFVFNSQTGNWYSKYGIGNTLIYAFPLAFERFVLGKTEMDPPSEIFGSTSGPYDITRRLLLLNGFNIALTLLLALVLYRLSRLYTTSGLTASLFVLACLYSTYLWNYTRAHSSQVYQVLFFSLGLLFLLRLSREPTRPAPRRSRYLLWCVLSISALCLVKLVFLPLMGVFAIATLLIGWNGHSNPLAHAVSNLRENMQMYLTCGLLPLLALAATLLWVNEIKFGSPLNMGYERETNLFGGRLAESIPAYLFAARYSIFLHFPLLAVGLIGIPGLWKQRRYDLVVAWTSFVTMFVIYSSYTYWTAEASYGPRYLLFALPALSLPCVCILDRLRNAQHSWLRAVSCIALAVLVLGASAAQTFVNRLEFHTFFRLRQQFQLLDRRDPELWDYLRNTNTAQFNRDFIRYRDHGVIPLPMQRLRSSIGPQRYRNVEASVRAHLASNHYFW